MKKTTFFIIMLLFLAETSYASSKDAVNKTPCMGLSHSVEISECMINLAESKKINYKKEYETYLRTVTTEEERPFDKKVIAKLVGEAKKNWEVYIEKECLAEASVYEEGNSPYIFRYNYCLIKHYEERIKYYRENKF
ncbi:lysozyme inhibitor LprI family protein [Erwinia psidii]|uniref:DUF1311 domain-containing protein n=1 Tax=Erwinia psidii TaxID=69224 RepID=A0A3N6UKS5_9GAMM|nr:lysozyme inhibitor LprI family protein [Erwinia psidii]MCX8959836.1 DUF1311 domain-containing protein [Erwinia psidii]MCX8966467.1 DUF1311 domain-containing protein [Erwinia psidii]RQM36539.1 DUF1311 domain-containing protein [Erwinia psidii]